MRGAESEFGPEELSFIAIDRAEWGVAGSSGVAVSCGMRQANRFQGFMLVLQSGSKKGQRSDAYPAKRIEETGFFCSAIPATGVRRRALRRCRRRGRVLLCRASGCGAAI